MRTHPNSSVEFFIVGFLDAPNAHVPLFIFFLLVYMLTITGNLILILLIIASPALQSPMYFFLCNLSALDIVYTSVTCPKLIDIFASNSGRISYVGCMVQLFFCVGFWNTEYFLLTAMSYDRYVAICKPLHYTVIMNRRLCIITAAGTWIGGLLGSISITTVAALATYHLSNKLNHFYCDIKALEKLAMGDTTSIRNAIFAHGLIFVMSSFVFILITYVYIISSILKIRSRKGKSKAFSTCASHLTVVSVFYVLLFDLYFRPKASISLNEVKVLTVFIAYIIPLLNPIIYSFRNKDVKNALRNVMKKKLIE
ncbi:hypothetical protein GDO78_018780 [Eleutherodactylus coqui]|uniref:Olfactory receptor n=1 Tax=Eleutherodactylus coqui TaxID=57060 RepID=A0A8J6EIU3_ELECQ|nr:hypothetical protein GDO78_018780 [Eleutherodactylus coqui]